MQRRIKNRILWYTHAGSQAGRRPAPKTFSDGPNARGVRLDHQTTTKGQNPTAFSLPTYLSVYVTVTLKPSGLPCDTLQEAAFLSLKRKNKGVGGWGIDPYSLLLFGDMHCTYFYPPSSCLENASNGNVPPDSGYLCWPTSRTYV